MLASEIRFLPNETSLAAAEAIEESDREQIRDLVSALEQDGDCVQVWTSIGGLLDVD